MSLIKKNTVKALSLYTNSMLLPANSKDRIGQFRLQRGQLAPKYGLPLAIIVTIFVVLANVMSDEIIDIFEVSAKITTSWLN